MQNKPGPRKKPGERYPSGDLKPAVAPALWGRARRGGDPQLSSELARLCFNRELTETQAAAGFRIADIYRNGNSADSLDDRRGVAAASEPVNPRVVPESAAGSGRKTTFLGGSICHALRDIGGRYHILANSPAHLEAQFGCDGHVSQIKKTVNVAPE